MSKNYLVGFFFFRKYVMERGKLMMQERLPRETSLSNMRCWVLEHKEQNQFIHRSKYEGYLKQTLVGG